MGNGNIFVLINIEKTLRILKSELELFHKYSIVKIIGMVIVIYLLRLLVLSQFISIIFFCVNGICFVKVKVH